MSRPAASFPHRILLRNSDHEKLSGLILAGGSDLGLLSPILSNKITKREQPRELTHMTLGRSCTTFGRIIASLEYHPQAL